MYKIIESQVEMTRDAIDKEFQGKWVYLVHLKYDEHKRFTHATPVVCSDEIFGGVAENIYDKFTNDIYGPTLSYNLLPVEENFTTLAFLG